MTIDTTFLPLRSRFVYGATGEEVDLEMMLPVRPWDRSTPTVGGSRISAAGIPGAYIVRRDHRLVLPLRFLETAWAGIHALIAWGQAGESFTWYPDALEAGTSFLVWLDSPAPGEDIAPSRSSDYPKMLELTITIRNAVADQPWELDFYGV